MPTPGEHKTVQAWILAYAQEIGWTYVPLTEMMDEIGAEAEARGMTRETVDSLLKDG